MFWKKRIAAFKAAGRGVVMVFREETHARIHALAAVLALGGGVFLGLERWEWAVLCLCIGLVTALEAVNTAIERLTDLASPQIHPLAGKAKDAAAAAVLLASVSALAVGALLFGPRIYAMMF